MIFRSILAFAVSAAAPGAFAAELDCVIKPKDRIEISAGSDGRIVEVAVGRGDMVQPGDVVVRLDDELQRLQLELSRARASDSTGLRSQEKRLEFRQKELDRASELSARNVTSQTVREDAEIEVALTELAVEEARLARRLAEIEMRQASAQLERRRITSPVAGIVTEVSASPGEFAGEQTVLLTLAETNPLYVEVFAPLEYLPVFNLGDRLAVRLAAPLTGEYTGTVTVIDRVFNAASGTFGMRLEIDNPDGVLPVGVRCSVLVPHG